MTHGIVLFGHGSRDPLWHKPIEAVAAQIAQASSAQVCCAYLELSAPDLPTAVRAMVTHGVESLVIVPMFLGVGKHAREDLPNIVTTLRREFPQVKITLQVAVGEDPRLVKTLAEIALTAANP